jgi:hypothetical protein
MDAHFANLQPDVDALPVQLADLLYETLRLHVLILSRISA